MIENTFDSTAGLSTQLDSSLSLSSDSNSLFGRSSRTLDIPQSYTARASSLDAVEVTRRAAVSVTGSGVFVDGLSLANGVTTDAAGNIFVSSVAGGLPVVTKFAPNGAGVYQIRTPGIAATKLAYDASLDRVIALEENGFLTVFDANTGQTTGAANVKQIPIDTSAIVDISSGNIDNFGGLIQPAFSSFGDIAVLNGQGFTDLYISAISQAFPYVIRLRFLVNGGFDADVLVSSRASAAPTDNIAPGIAVNPQGVVLTTLPIAGNIGTFNVAVALPYDWDGQQRTGSFVPQVVLSGAAVSSRGITADRTGNFYIGTSAIGASFGGVSGSGILVLTPNAQFSNFISFNQALSRVPDLAVSPQGDRLYAIADTGGGAFIASTPVVVFGLAAPVAQMSLAGLMESSPETELQGESVQTFLAIVRTVF
jgi:hypothetical protein